MSNAEGRVLYDVTLLGDADLHLFNEGTHTRLYEHLGAHVLGAEHGVEGTYFAVWAPGARRVSVIGDFNDWRPNAHPLRRRETSGVWEGTVPAAGVGHRYKYRVVSGDGEHIGDKADPLAFATEQPPRTASIISGLDYAWGDGAWMRNRGRRTRHDAPISVYEVHLGSWRRPADGAGHLSYREIAPLLADYVTDTGFTHVELMPVMEHPFYGSWGYQSTAYFAPTARYGSPQDLMYLIDVLHQHGIGVILDWVPSHFPCDAHGLGYFDGSHLYEHADPRQGFHPDWNSFIFNYGRHEVRSFLTASALFWLDRYHADGLRVDAVASMLYLDYSRNEGEWIPNRYGGRENLEAIEFLRRLNEVIYEAHPDVQTFAEESTAWPAVSHPTHSGGLGFGYKWDMGWMHDTLAYMGERPVHRKHHHKKLTFRMLYAWAENFVLPLSHDEVVHGKGSLAGKMQGTADQKLANLRLMLGYMYAQPGKKLLFMGGELGQWSEWDHDATLDWKLLDSPEHAGVRRWVRTLNRLYRGHPALHAGDHETEGFSWVDADDAGNAVLSFLRRAENAPDVLVVCNFAAEAQPDYLVGAPGAGRWVELANSCAEEYVGGGGARPGPTPRGAAGAAATTTTDSSTMVATTENQPADGYPQSLRLSLAPTSIVFLEHHG